MIPESELVTVNTIFLRSPTHDGSVNGGINPLALVQPQVDTVGDVDVPHLVGSVALHG